MKLFFTSILATCSILSCAAQPPNVSQLLYVIEGKEVAYPRLSNDGKKILYQSNQNGPWELYIMDIAAKTHEKVMADGSNNNFPDWSADNEWIGFVSDRTGNEEIYVMRKDGSELKKLTEHPARDIHPYFSPDGKQLLFNSTRANESFDVFQYDLQTGILTQLTNTPQDETCARFTPDMSSIVLLKNDPSSDDVYSMDVKTGSLQNISNTPHIRDGWPMTSYDNQWVYYSSAESGSYCIYRIRPDGTDKTKLTDSGGHDDARVCIARDGKSFIYNQQRGRTIEIRQMNM